MMTMSPTTACREDLGEGSASAPGGHRLGLVLGMLVLPMYVAQGAPSVALPTIGRALAVPFGATAWILAAWSLTSALAMPVAGRLTARWGPDRVLVGGVVGLAAGCGLAALGPTLPVVIIGRLVGGAGAGATVIAAVAAASALPGRERARALGVIAGASATASACGTLLGGAVTTWLGWRAVLAAPALALLVLLVVSARGRTLTGSGGRGCTDAGGRLDLAGAAVLAVPVASLITLLQAHAVGLPTPVTLVVGAAGVLAAVGLGWRVHRVPDGFVPRRVIAARGLPAAGFVGAAVFTGYYGVLFFAPSAIEHATGGGALEAGILLVPAAVSAVLAGRLVAVATRRFTAWRLAAGLAGITAAGVLVAAVAGGPVPVVVGVALTGIGFAGAQVVLVGLAPDLVAADDLDTAQGLLNFMIFLGGAVGPAAVAGLSGVTSVPVTLAVLAALPLAGLAVSLIRRPGAGPDEGATP